MIDGARGECFRLRRQRRSWQPPASSAAGGGIRPQNCPCGSLSWSPASASQTDNPIATVAPFPSEPRPQAEAELNSPVGFGAS